MSVTNGLYSIHIEMTEGGRGHATGIIVLLDGKIAGGDSHFYYSGTFTAERGKWRGELISNEHAKSVGVLPLFGGREVTCGFSGSYSADTREMQRDSAGREDQRRMARRTLAARDAIRARYASSSIFTGNFCSRRCAVTALSGAALTRR